MERFVANSIVFYFFPSCSFIFHFHNFTSVICLFLLYLSSTKRLYMYPWLSTRSVPNLQTLPVLPKPRLQWLPCGSTPCWLHAHCATHFSLHHSFTLPCTTLTSPTESCSFLMTQRQSALLRNTLGPGPGLHCAAREPHGDSPSRKYINHLLPKS